ncbi:hypothetical protein DICSQDRAFT_173271 [Dichomitus squalens LYAD-421 SS1]|uniref:Uncharacterized protein n=1 Tax=Dichomitus squalens (strain LYAD-421) TaxID=732165 RepID=R7SQK4_DICSQ|nr:uncharacterized protein DICSQDRAFT_173271 [Dichomitus squalens LYAD-421 SS1]EJF58183.1 hypothetical protein DICSQDRAFT_173271 [Dichomitus squalens LYAD-421 SS1]
MSTDDSHQNRNSVDSTASEVTVRPESLPRLLLWDTTFSSYSEEEEAYELGRPDTPFVDVNLSTSRIHVESDTFHHAEGDAVEMQPHLLTAQHAHAERLPLQHPDAQKLKREVTKVQTCNPEHTEVLKLDPTDSTPSLFVPHLRAQDEASVASSEVAQPSARSLE